MLGNFFDLLISNGSDMNEGEKSLGKGIGDCHLHVFAENMMHRFQLQKRQ
jgi:hypothetical protein